MYKFKSRATGDLIMLEPNARQILRIIGKDDSALPGQGILLPPQMTAAIAALEVAIALDDSARQQMIEEAQKKGATSVRPEGISLRQRATPFITMVQRCQKANTEIVWGV